MKLTAHLPLAAICSLIAFSPALAQENGRAPPTPEEQAQQATQLRQGLLRLMAWSWAPTAAMLKTHKVDAAVVQKTATRVQQLSQMIPDAFRTDTRSFNVKTRARPAVWASSGEFVTKAEGLTKAANALLSAAQGSDEGAILKAAADVGKACGACHDDFRERQATS